MNDSYVVLDFYYNPLGDMIYAAHTHEDAESFVKECNEILGDKYKLRIMRKSK